MLLRIAGALREERMDFARLLTAEQGKPLRFALREVDLACGLLRAFAAMDLPIQVLRESESARIVRQHTPLGVVAAITPWNFPLSLMMFKLPPALLAGNTVVAKPAPTTPLTTLKFGELCADILPPGVLNVVADQNDLGEALTSHPGVAKVAFTGSTATGKKILANVSATLKRVTLELGGNDAAIVLDDADPAELAPKLFNAAMMNTGQVCLAIKRLYVHESIHAALCDGLARLADQAVVGDGFDEQTQFGPVQNLRQFQRLKELLVDTHARGKVIAGGTYLERPGFFMRPTIVRDIPDDARIVREEQFGPILPVLCYSSIDDALERINDSDYGLSATVWGRDTRRALDVALRIDAGTVWINKHLDLPLDLPFGGAKHSGIGVELGQAGLEQFTQVKLINAALPGV